MALKGLRTWLKEGFQRHPLISTKFITSLKTLSEAATVPGSERMLGQMALRSGDQQQALRHLKSAVSARRDDFVAQRELRRLEA